MGVKIKTESEFCKWFLGNYKNLRYHKIIKKDNGFFPDFIMLKDNKEIKVELETLSSNFILHKHNEKLVDEVICIKKDVDLKVPILEVTELDFIGNKRRISATIDEKTLKLIDKILKNGKYRNKSHVIEKAIEVLNENK